MGKEKRLTIALAFCGLALFIAVGALAHVYQESREQGECLTAAQRQIEVLETQLSQVTKETAQMEEQMTLIEAEKAEAEKERDNAQRQYEWATKRDNPIDRYLCAEKRPMAITTFAMDMETWFKYEAWSREFECALAWVEEDCGTVYEEDKQLLKEYRAAIEAQADPVYDLTYLHVARFYPPEDRWGNIGTLASSAVSGAQAEVYRKGTLFLLDTYAYAMDSEYPYFFQDETRNEIIEDILSGGNESIRESIEYLFPPISQVLPD